MVRPTIQPADTSVSQCRSPTRRPKHVVAVNEEYSANWVVGLFGIFARARSSEVYMDGGGRFFSGRYARGRKCRSEVPMMNDEAAAWPLGKEKLLVVPSGLEEILKYS